MADINTVYSGTIDQQDPDIVIAKVPAFWPWEPAKNLYLPDEVRDKIRKANIDAQATIDAVIVPYTGPDRILWLNQRLTAINERVKFIKSRTDELLTRLQSTSTDSYNVLTKVVTSALALVPVVGTATTFAVNQANTAQSLEQYKVQSLIQDYASDLQQLANIRNQLVKELASTTVTIDPTNEAPTAIPAWYYLVGIGLLLLFFVWLRRRNQKRRKR